MNPMHELQKRCEAQTGNGTPCRRFPIRGGTRCTLHGGGTPQARRVALEMLALARLPAARALLRVIEDWEADACDACGRPCGDPGPVIRAATAVLDRTGFHPAMTVQVDHGEPPAASWLRWLSRDRFNQILLWRDEARARMAAGLAPEPRQSYLPEAATPTTLDQSNWGNDHSSSKEQTGKDLDA